MGKKPFMDIRTDREKTEIVRSLEQAEVAAWSDLYQAASNEAVLSCGIKLITTPSTCTVFASQVDVLAFNRVIGLGIKEPITEGMLDDLISQFRLNTVRRFFLQLNPLAVTPEVRGWLVRRGIRRHNNWVKLYRNVDMAPRADSDLRIERIDQEYASTFSDTLVSSFEWPRVMIPWIAETVGRLGWRHYMAFDGATPVATAALFVEGKCGWIDFASTLPAYRGRGAQGALTELRIRDAAELGCTWLVVETAEETPDHPVPSYRNMRRYGFDVAYVRPNYILDDQPDVE